MAQSSEKGFSLVELLVAMVITLIVSGAIYGLMTAGQNAFRREPELAERQQNIRLAMDMIVRDLANAGTGLPPLTQVFTQNLEAVAASPAGPSGAAHSDDIELLTVTGRESEPVCTGTNNGQYPQTQLVRNSIASIDPGTMMFLVFTSPFTTPPAAAPAVHDDMWTMRRVTSVGAPNPIPPSTLVWSECLSNPGSNHAVLNFAGVYPENAATLCENSPVAPGGNFIGPGCNGNILTRVVFGRLVRYQVRNDPADGVPVLERVSSDQPGSPPQVLARGIEEMQIQYTQFSAPTAWLDGAPNVDEPANEDWAAANAKFGSIVNRVRVTLTSRSEARNIQGAVNRADNTDPRLRGSLSSTVTPRAALLSVTYGRPSPDPGPWYWE
jgi:prepilin-type N-terminal cleavage/methylation domain-containing protein